MQRLGCVSAIPVDRGSIGIEGFAPSASLEFVMLAIEMLRYLTAMNDGCWYTSRQQVAHWIRARPPLGLSQLTRGLRIGSLAPRMASNSGSPPFNLTATALRGLRSVSSSPHFGGNAMEALD